MSKGKVHYGHPEDKWSKCGHACLKDPPEGYKPSKASLVLSEVTCQHCLRYFGRSTMG